ncbi:MAG: endolytic transglycosylase MltG [Gammaproteobacteria bacterium]
MNLARAYRKLAIGVLLILATLTALAVAAFWQWTFSPLPIQHPVVLTVPRAETLHALSSGLAREGVLANWWSFDLLGRISGQGRDLQAGQYRIVPGMTETSLLRELVMGRVILYHLTLVPGATFADLRREIEADPDIRKPKVPLSASWLMAQLGHPGESAEGVFAPDTYFFPRGTSVPALLKRAYRRMQRILRVEWMSRAPDRMIQTPYEALTLASIIEKESAYRMERPRIAGVFIRRLTIGMPLQSDPTVIYGMGASYHGQLTAADLAIDSPWNTYLHRGLPPTPISYPSRNAIHAALHPLIGKDLYFVSMGDGRHIFARTLTAQNRHVERYLKPAPPHSQPP